MNYNYFEDDDFYKPDKKVYESNENKNESEENNNKLSESKQQDIKKYTPLFLLLGGIILFLFN
jgi:hypothetical protein